MADKVLMVIEELDKGLRPDPTPPIVQVSLVDIWFILLMVMIEVDIGIIPDNYIHILMVDYTLYTQGSLNNIFQRVCKEKISKQVSMMCVISTSKPSLLLLLSNHATTPLSNYSTKTSSKHFTTYLSRHATIP